MYIYTHAYSKHFIFVYIHYIKYRQILFNIEHNVTERMCLGTPIKYVCVYNCYRHKNK